MSAFLIIKLQLNTIFCKLSQKLYHRNSTKRIQTMATQLLLLRHNITNILNLTLPHVRVQMKTNKQLCPLLNVSLTSSYSLTINHNSLLLFMTSNSEITPLQGRCHRPAVAPSRMPDPWATAPPRSQVPCKRIVQPENKYKKHDRKCPRTAFNVWAPSTKSRTMTK